MRFDHRDQKAAPDVTADVVLMVLLTAKANHAAIDLLATALPVIDHRAMAKVVRHVMEKVGLHEKVRAVVREMAKAVLPKGVDANRGVAMVLRAVQWGRRILNVSWKMRCVSMPTLMVS